MKRATQVIVIFLCCSVGKIYGTTDRELTVRSAPVDIKSNIWEFSQESSTSGMTYPFYRQYGDSLITEIWQNNRQWYTIKGDSAMYVGEETRFHKAFYETPIPTSAFGNIWLADDRAADARGRYYHTIELGQEGTYTSSLPVKGKIFFGETVIPAVAVTEIRKFTSHIGPDSITICSIGTKEVSRTRWFVDGDRLPVAMQITEKDFIQDKEISSETYAYHLVADDIPISDEIRRNTEIQQALDNADIIHENGSIIISGDFPTNTTLVLYLSNIQGNRFHQQPLEGITEGLTTQIYLPDMPPGQYIVTISAGTPTDRKVIINI